MAYHTAAEIAALIYILIIQQTTLLLKKSPDTERVIRNISPQRIKHTHTHTHKIVLKEDRAMFSKFYTMQSGIII